jgi:hypothetical protein
MLLTAYEVSQKYGLSIQHVRLLMRKKVLSGRGAQLNKTRIVWLIDEDSVKRYKATKPRPGRKPAQKRSK